MNARSLFSIGTLIGVIALVAGCGGGPGEAASSTAALSSAQALASAEALYSPTQSQTYKEEQASLVDGAWDVQFVSGEGAIHSVVSASSGEIVSTELLINTCKGTAPKCAGGKAAHCCGLDGGWSCFVCE